MNDRTSCSFSLHKPQALAEASGISAIISALNICTIDPHRKQQPGASRYVAYTVPLQSENAILNRRNDVDALRLALKVNLTNPLVIGRPVADRAQGLVPPQEHKSLERRRDTPLIAPPR